MIPLEWLVSLSGPMASEQGLNRRKFITSGLTFGGSRLGAPSAASTRRENIAALIRALRSDVAQNDTRDERLRRARLSKLDRAIEAAKAGKDDLVCALLKKFIQVGDQNGSTAEALTASKERVWEQVASDIRKRVGCNGDSTGSTGSAGPLAQA